MNRTYINERGTELSRATKSETPLGTCCVGTSLSEKLVPVDYRSFNAILQQSVNFNLTYINTT